MLSPPAIMFVNDDCGDPIIDHLQRQLQINQTMDGYTFDQNVATIDNYVAIIYQLNQRVLVVRSFIGIKSVSTYNIPDVVIYCRRGLAYIENALTGSCKCGNGNKRWHRCHHRCCKGVSMYTVPIMNITWGALKVY